jgi:hypothetical protein
MRSAARRTLCSAATHRRAARVRNQLEMPFDRARESLTQRRSAERLPEQWARALASGTPALDQVLQKQRIAGRLRVK